MGENTRQQEIEKVYLSILANNTHPFEQAVSRNDVRSQSDSFDISRPHKTADRRINRALQLIQRSHLPKLTPLLGEAGAGKTHYYWTLKDREKFDANSGNVEVHPWTIIYVPSPPMALNIPLHILTCLIDDQGEDLIVSTALNLFKKFKTSIQSSFENVKNKIVNYYGGVHSEVIRVLMQFIWPGISQKEKQLAKRWLYADNLTKDERADLKVKNNIENDDVVLNLLHLIDEFSGKTLIYFFDEMELIYRMFGAESEIKLWEIIKKLFNESRNSLFITTCLLDVWERVQNNLDSSVISRFEPEIHLQAFNYDECQSLYLTLMGRFWQEYFLESLPNQYFPLTEAIIEFIYKKSNGNPRQIIKLVSKIFEQIINEEIDSAKMSDGAKPDLVSQFMAKYTETSMIGKYAEPTSEDYIASQHRIQEERVDLNRLLPRVLQPKNRKAKLQVENEEYFVEVNPTSLISALISILNVVNDKILKNMDNSFDLLYEYPYEMQGMRKKLALLIEKMRPPEKVGISIPVINKLGNLSKAKGYFYILECSNALNRGLFSRMVLILPEGLIDRTGSIATTLEEFSDDLFLLELSETLAIQLIEATAPVNIDILLQMDQVQSFLEFCFPEHAILPLLKEVSSEDNAFNLEMVDEVDKKFEDLRDFLLELNK